MNEKEIAEIRRRFNPDKNNIADIRGCYVNENQEIVSEFDQSFNLMSQEEAENILAILKRTLSGTIGKNLLDITFETQQVVDSDEHRLLMALRDSALKDEESVKKFFQCVIGSLAFKGSYLILLTHDTYNISSEIYSYILCSICPIKATKPAISYYVSQNEFHNCQSDWLVAPPELGFLFPAFDDRITNIYNSLYYSRDTKENHQEFVDAVFNSKLPMPAAAQKEAFGTIIEDSLEEDCSYEVVQAVHDQLCDMIEEHKVNKEVEPLVISKDTVKDVLQACGVSDLHLNAFDEKFDMEFGLNADINPRNIVDTKQFEVRMPNIIIHVDTAYSNLIQTRVIDGAKYILIRVDEDVAVNGVNINISDL